VPELKFWAIQKANYSSMGWSVSLQENTGGSSLAQNDGNFYFRSISTFCEVVDRGKLVVMLRRVVVVVAAGCRILLRANQHRTKIRLRAEA
jgi:hypothetical protein